MEAKGRRGALVSNRRREQGRYCPDCGALYALLGSGYTTEYTTCQKCGRLGLRGFDKRPIRVGCSVADCDFVGWDDGGVNDDLDRHMRRDHANAEGP